MNTVQRYSGKGNNAFPTSPTAENAASIPTTADQWQPPHPLSVAEFLPQHANDLRGLPADELDEQLRELLAKHPVSYSQPQDALMLLENLLPAQTATSPDAHYACLLRGNLIVGLVSVNQNDSLPGEPATELLTADDLDVRYLTGRLLEAGATELLLLSIQHTGRELLATERAFIADLRPALDLMHVALIDWLVQTGGQTPAWSSWLAVTHRNRTVAPAATPVVLKAATVEEFITGNADLRGRYHDDLAQHLTQRLQASPMAYDTVLDGIALLRTFLPAPPAHAPAHYALLLRNNLIMGVCWLPISHDIETDFLFAYEDDTRQLLLQALALNANTIIMATTLGTGMVANPWAVEKEVKAFDENLHFLGIDLHDWLLLYPGENFSFCRQTLDGEIDDEGVSSEALSFYGIIQDESAGHA